MWVGFGALAGLVLLYAAGGAAKSIGLLRVNIALSLLVVLAVSVLCSSLLTALVGRREGV